MTSFRWTYPLAIALFATTSAGCASTAVRFYTLDPTAAAGGAPAVHDSVLVGPVSVPTSVDRPQFVIQVAPNRVEIDEFNLWAAPLEEGIARVVAADLVMLLGTREVATAPLANFDAAWRVTIDVQRFDSVPGGNALLDAVWTVTPRAATASSHTGRTITQEPVAVGMGYESIAAAHSRALARLSGDVAAAIRAAAETAATPKKKR